VCPRKIAIRWSSCAESAGCSVFGTQVSSETRLAARMVAFEDNRRYVGC
jgi:hypothetical protein